MQHTVTNLTNPSAFTDSGSISVFGMGPEPNASNAPMTANGTLFVDANELKISGNVTLENGRLGSGSIIVVHQLDSRHCSITAQHWPVRRHRRLQRRAHA